MKFATLSKLLILLIVITTILSSNPNSKKQRRPPKVQQSNGDRGRNYDDVEGQLTHHKGDDADNMDNSDHDNSMYFGNEVQIAPKKGNIVGAKKNIRNSIQLAKAQPLKNFDHELGLNTVQSQHLNKRRKMKRLKKNH